MKELWVPLIAVPLALWLIYQAVAPFIEVARTLSKALGG